MNAHDKGVLEKIRQGKRRVLIYGNMNYAIESMVFLKNNGIPIEAFVVDHWAGVLENEIEGIPVLKMEKYISRLSEFDVVLGFVNVEKCRVMMGLGEWLKTNVYMLWEPGALFEWNHEWYLEHAACFEEAKSYLSDALSKKTLDALLSARETGDIKPLMQLAVPDQYFNYLTYEKETGNEIFVDGGAFSGDTILAYEGFTSGKYKKIIAFEPDRANIDKILENTKWMHDIQVIPQGLWSSNTTLRFTSEASESRIDETGIHAVDVTTIDSLMDKGEAVSFIKLDIEGAEYQALCGAEGTLRKYMPKLAICVYHKCDDIFKFISFLKNFSNDVSEYAFYLRHHTCTAYETVLYAVPQRKH